MRDDFDTQMLMDIFQKNTSTSTSRNRGGATREKFRLVDLRGVLTKYSQNWCVGIVLHRAVDVDDSISIEFSQ